VTDRSGSSVLDVGRSFAGPGPERLDAALRELLGPTTRHGGALLAPFGIRYVVARRGALPSAAASALDAQLDVNLVPASGFVIYRNAAVIPPAAVLATEASDRTIVRAGDPATIATWRPVRAAPLVRVPGGWDGPPGKGAVFVSTEYDAGWRLSGTEAEPAVAFGWATVFEARGDAPIRIRHEGRLPGRIQVVVLALLWVVALWATRKPVPR
jgi:hypothetical protein